MQEGEGETLFLHLFLLAFKFYVENANAEEKLNSLIVSSEPFITLLLLLLLSTPDLKQEGCDSDACGRLGGYVCTFTAYTLLMSSSGQP